MSSTTERVQPELLTAPEAARLLGIGRRTLARWAAEGKAPAGIKLSPGKRGAIRWRRSDLLTWIENDCQSVRG